MNRSISVKRIIACVLILGGALLLLAPTVFLAANTGTRGVADVYRGGGGLLLVLGVTFALCVRAGSGSQMGTPNRRESVPVKPPAWTQDRPGSETAQDVTATADTTVEVVESSTLGTALLDRWQILPWLPLCIVVVAVAAFLLLHQLTLNRPGAERDPVLLPLVLVCALCWPVAAGTAATCLVRLLVIKARGRATGSVWSPFLGAIVCGLLAPIWLMAMMMILQAR